MSTPSLTDILNAPTQAQVLAQEVLPTLVANKVNVTSWPLGGMYRTMAMVVAFMRTNTRVMLAAMCAAGFEDYVFGRVPAPGGMDVTGWAPFVAKQRYGLVQKPATYTKRLITLTNVSGSSYPNLQPGSTIILSFPSGNRYFLDGPADGSGGPIGIPASGSVQAIFRSEFAAATGSTYNSDPAGSTIGFVTSRFAGVAATNPAPTFSPVAQAGSGIGTVTPSGTPVGGQHSVAVKITATGSVSGSTVRWSTSLDGDVYIPQTGSSVSNLGGSGITVTLADASGSPAFVKDAVYYFTTPGSDLVQLGATIETPQALGQRVAGLWPLLGWINDPRTGAFIPPASPTLAAYEALALSSNLNVAIAFAVTNGRINNQVDIYIAGQGGVALTPAVIANVQVFFASFNMVTDAPVVTTPTAREVTLSFASGAIGVKAAQRASAQAAMQSAIQAYMGGVDAGQPLGINGLVDYDYLISLIRRTPGVTHAPGGGAFRINSAAADLQLPVTSGAIEVAQLPNGFSVATAFPWTTS